jgi:hypothetical protein
MEQPKNSDNRKKIIGIVTSVAGFAIAYFVTQQLFKPTSFDKAMMEAASEINKTCPFMVDQETRLDNTVALPDNIFQYNYTLVNYDKSEVNNDTIRKYVEPGIVNNVKTNPSLKSFRDNKVTMQYQYKDKNGVFLLSIVVTPDQYTEK